VLAADGDSWISRAWRRLRGALAIPVVAAAVVAALARLPYYADSVGFDATLYLPVARGWLDGLSPYRDVFADKGPLVYLLLTGEQALAPTSLPALRFAFLLLIVASAALLAALVERHAGRRVAWASAVIYALACSSTLWEFNDINTEQVGLPLMVAAVDLADRYSLSGRWWQALGAGTALGASFWAKPSVAFVGLLILFLLLMRPSRRWLGIGLAAVGGLAASAAVLAPYAAAGALGELKWSQTHYNHHYVSGGFENLVHRSLHEQVAWIFNGAGSAFFVAALALGGLAWMLGRHRRLVAIAATWFVLEYAGAKFGVRDFAHYFVPVLAPCAILIAVGGDALAAHLTGIENRARTALVVCAWLPLATFLVFTGALQRLQTGADPSVPINNQIADVVDEVTATNARIYVAGFDTGFQIYWDADRNPATRFFWAEGMGASPYSYDPHYVSVVERTLRRRPPAAVVVWPSSQASSTNDYVAPAIRRGGLHQVAELYGVKIYATRGPPNA
jgi:4-amino-4-deoxy-L-arabinose transferase-like glycosyltransferase